MNLQKIKLATLLFLFGVIFSTVAMPVLALNPDKNYPSDLLAYWKFDDRLNPVFQQTVGVGLVSDETIYNNFGELQNDASITIDGKFDDAVEFDGTDDFIKVSNNPILNQTIFSVLLWANFADTDPSVDQFIIGKANPPAFDEGWIFILSASLSLTIGVATDDPAVFLASFDISTLATDTWFHISATFDGSELRLYLDGALKDNTDSITGNLIIAEDLLTIGASELSAFDFAGKLDEIALYNRTLSEDEIKDRFENGIPEEEVPFALTTLILPSVIVGGIIVAILFVFMVSRRETGAKR